MAKGRVAGAVLALAGWLGAGPAAADGRIDPGEREAARQLVEALADPAGVERTFGRLKQQFRERMLTARQNRGREAEIDRLFDEVVLPEMRARYAATLERRAEAMALALTPEQIQANTAFWGGDTGRAVLSVPRGEDFERRMFDGMADRLGMIDGLTVRNRMNALGDAVRKHTDAARAARANGD